MPITILLTEYEKTAGSKRSGGLFVYVDLSVTERNSVRICVDVSAEYHYTLNESPYYAYLTEQAEAQQCEQKLRYTLACIAEIEVVYAESAEKDTEQTSCHLRLCSGRSKCLTSAESRSAVYTYCCSGLYGISAVPAILLSAADIAAAHRAGCCTVFYRMTAILTIHTPLPRL